jgi:hypothetical protein
MALVREQQRFQNHQQDIRLTFEKTFARCGLVWYRSLGRPGSWRRDRDMRGSRTRSARVVSPRRLGASVAAALALSLGVFTGAATAAAPGSATYQEPFRPQFHFTPAQTG